MRTRSRVAAACLAIALPTALALYYMASPLIAAYQLRQAVQAGNSPAIEAMVDWPSLRESVRRTVSQNANLLPVAEAAARRASTSWWQRLRSAFGHTMIDRFIERYITPKGLPELYRAKSKSHEPRQHGPNQVIEAGIVPPHIKLAWQRVKRAEFTSPFRFVLEIEDRHKASRLIESTFRFSGIGITGIRWKLTAISIRDTKRELARLNGP